MRPPQLAPCFTPETARKAQEKGYETKIQQKNARIKELEQQLRDAITALEDDEQARKSTLRKQMAKCDEQMAKEKKPGDFKRWADAKAKLWELLYPKPGSLRPSKTRDRQTFAPIAPLPVEPKPALVVSPESDNHNVQNPSSQVAA